MPTDDPLGAVFAGDEPPNSARTWTRLMAAGRSTQRNQLGAAALADAPELAVEPASTVLIRAGARGIAPFTVSAYGPSPLDAARAPAEARRRPVFDFRTPSAEADPVCITVDGVGPGANARAACAGVALTRLLVRSAAHRFAAPIPGVTTRLGSAQAGYPILHKWGSSGEVWAFVLLDRGGTAGGSGSGAAGGAGCDLETITIDVVTDVNLTACTVTRKRVVITGCGLSAVVLP